MSGGLKVRRVILVARDAAGSGVGRSLLNLATTPPHGYSVQVFLAQGRGPLLAELATVADVETAEGKGQVDFARQLRVAVKATGAHLVHFIERPAGTLILPPGVPVCQSQNTFSYGPRGVVRLALQSWLADRVIAVSSEVAKRIKRLSGHRAVVVPEGTPMPPFVHLRPADPPKSIRLAVLSRLTEEKGLGLLPEILVEARRRGLPLSVAVYGEGPMRAVLDQTCGHLTETLEFHGFVPDQWEPFRSIDALLFLSPVETFGRPVAEALGVGIPIVAAPLPRATRDLLTRDVERSAVIAGSRDAESMCDAIELFMQRSFSPRELHEHFLSRLSLDEQVRRYRDVWDRILKE